MEEAAALFYFIFEAIYDLMQKSLEHKVKCKNVENQLWPVFVEFA